jgi:hypothetical protein
MEFLFEGDQLTFLKKILMDKLRSRTSRWGNYLWPQIMEPFSEG